MGCGGSSVYAEDGSIAPGGGETKIEWNPEKPIEVGFYYYTEKDAKVLVKEFPMNKECADKVFSADNVVSSSGGMHWVKVVPGNRYCMKYTEGGHSVGFPGQQVLNIPKKVHEFHTKDDAAKDKLAEDLKKDVEKDEANAYNKDDAKIKADIDAMAGLTTCADLPDEMDKFKKGCMTAEDLQPWNTINPCLGLVKEYGYWEEKEGKLEQQLGLSEKAKVMAKKESAKKGPELTHMGMSKANDVFSKVIDGAVQGGCKKAGPEAEVLAPNLADRLAFMEGVAPSATRAEDRKLPEGAEAPKEEEEEAGVCPIEKAAKAEYEAQKGNLDALKSDDGTDYKSEAESYMKAVYGSISGVSPSADADKAVIGADKGFQVPVYVTGEDGEDVTVTFATTNFGDETSGKIAKQAVGSTISGSEAEENKFDAFTSLPEAKDDFLERGQSVTVKNGKAFNCGWVVSVNGDDVTVEDQFLVRSTVKKADCYTHLTQQQLATRGIGLLPNFAPLKLWWVAAEDPNVTVRKVKVWRFGAPETAQEFDLQAVKVKAKPTKEVENPTHEVHIGYTAEVPVLLGAKYAYNFKIGEQYFADWEKPLADDKGCSVFTCNTRVEYATSTDDM